MEVPERGLFYSVATGLLLQRNFLCGLLSSGHFFEDGQLGKLQLHAAFLFDPHCMIAFLEAVFAHELKRQTDALMHLRMM